MAIKCYALQDTPYNTLCFRTQTEMYSNIINTIALISKSKNPDIPVDNLKVSKSVVCQLAVRPTRARRLGPVSSHKKGNCYLNTNPLY